MALGNPILVYERLSAFVSGYVLGGTLDDNVLALEQAPGGIAAFEDYLRVLVEEEVWKHAIVGRT